MKNITRLFVLVLSLSLLILLTSCGEGNQNQYDKGNKIDTTVGIVVRNIYGEVVNGITLTYDGNALSAPAESVYYTVSVYEKEPFDINKLALRSDEYDYIKVFDRDSISDFYFTRSDCSQHISVIVSEKSLNTDFENDLVNISGKVVTHPDGENRVEGAEIRVGGRNVYTTNSTGNYNINYVKKGETLTVYKEGYTDVTISGTPRFPEYKVGIPAPGSEEDGYFYPFRLYPNELSEN